MGSERSLRNEQPSINWDELRQREAILAKNPHCLMMPWVAMAQRRSRWEADYVGRYQDADAAQYDYRLRSLFFKSVVTSRLTLYSTADIGRRAVVRIYDLDLRPGHERLDVVPVETMVSHAGVPADLPWDTPRGRKFIEQSGLQLPNQEDYEIVREQLARGASGCYPLRPQIDT